MSVRIPVHRHDCIFPDSSCAWTASSVASLADLPEFNDGKPRVILSEEMKKKVEIDIEEVDEDFLPVHDEL